MELVFEISRRATFRHTEFARHLFRANAGALAQGTDHSGRYGLSLDLLLFLSTEGHGWEKKDAENDAKSFDASHFFSLIGN